ncbi:hypothetical protein EJB05_44800, partial [Eragrostis curvula]
MTGDALPSIVSATSPEHPMHGAFQAFRDLFADIDEHRPKVLVNTFDALEPDALRAVPELEVVAVGPTVPDDVVSRHLRDVDATAAEGAYMAWLDTKAARSVVYVSFGSFVPMSARQEGEMRRGLEAAGRPYLWARTGAGATKQDDAEKEQEGIVVAWCEQVRVLSHPAVGCFVTHCWRSARASACARAQWPATAWWRPSSCSGASRLSWATASARRTSERAWSGGGSSGGRRSPQEAAPKGISGRSPKGCETDLCLTGTFRKADGQVENLYAAFRKVTPLSRDTFI